ncbi:MAG: hypothetical protein LBC35_04830 [Coriobacteriales bacterium]|nr:hypothetical protein [Coriobacteriales bacterium]
MDIQITGSTLTVSSGLAARLLGHYPALADHACKSGNTASGHVARHPDNQTAKHPNVQTAGHPSGHVARHPNGRPEERFGSRITGALLPHAVEHLAIELLVQANPGQVFAGNTTWLSRRRQVMRVRVSRQSGSDTLTAIKQAVEQINRLVALA